ncbi:nucleotidyltransferase domain-containing protein [Candidatus Woesearchaeota archaeon]|nr:nucleotidyltransferase domain-containing protein [Candidatus Woesearchaeota archaeon]
MDLAVKIVGLYDCEPKAELSIREIAKRLKATYSFVYAAVDKTAKEGVIEVAVKGRAKMCSLNLRNDKARALLAMHAINRKEEFLKKNRLIGQLLSEFVNRVAGEDVYSIVLFGSYAKGSASATSDVDLLVIGASKTQLDSKVDAEANSLEARYGKEVNAAVVDKTMFLKSLRSEAVTAVKEALADHVILSGFERFWELIGEGIK